MLTAGGEAVSAEPKISALMLTAGGEAVSAELKVSELILLDPATKPYHVRDLIDKICFLQFFVSI